MCTRRAADGRIVTAPQDRRSFLVALEQQCPKDVIRIDRAVDRHLESSTLAPAVGIIED